MNGPHDLGGQMGHGPINPEADEPLFHSEWERRAFAVTLAVGATGSWTLDQSRHARENLPPTTYLSSSYYRIWTLALEKLLTDVDLVSRDELDAGESLRDGRTVKRVLQKDAVEETLSKGGPVDRPQTSAPLFKPGDRIRTINDHPTGHTRLPRYAKGRPGIISAINGFHVFPDTNAHGGGEKPQWLYNVSFSGEDLWGRDAEPGLTIQLDLWEAYLEPVE
ncbi:nitrile hydratase subunit beta [Coralliovum pocilloporae]|uniref:nitrile hydratase subunit beta n=1 Tax=Coralliovum pocilloporae TaxID=3066369 RepID=UPI0033078958